MVYGCAEGEAARSVPQALPGSGRMLAVAAGQEARCRAEILELYGLHVDHVLPGGADRQASVCAGLSLSWSNGPTEGHINRLKCLKRQMYGRAKLDLLRQRLLAA